MWTRRKRREERRERGRGSERGRESKIRGKRDRPPGEGERDGHVFTLNAILLSSHLLAAILSECISSLSPLRHVSVCVCVCECVCVCVWGREQASERQLHQFPRAVSGGGSFLTIKSSTHSARTKEAKNILLFIYQLPVLSLRGTLAGGHSDRHDAGYRSPTHTHIHTNTHTHKLVLQLA